MIFTLYIFPLLKDPLGSTFTKHKLPEKGFSEWRKCHTMFITHLMATVRSSAEALSQINSRGLEGENILKDQNWDKTWHALADRRQGLQFSLPLLQSTWCFLIMTFHQKNRFQISPWRLLVSFLSSHGALWLLQVLANTSFIYLSTTSYLLAFPISLHSPKRGARHNSTHNKIWTEIWPMFSQ